jgi:hypothetical protein
VQRPEGVELTVQFRTMTHGSFDDLAQPFRTVPRSVHLLAGPRNAPTAVHGLDSIHHTDEILGDRQIAARKFPDRSQSCVYVVDLRELVEAQQSR